MKRTKVKTNKGITLIALVITIIVLLILAGISIAMLTGDNGILTQANKAKLNTEIADEKETVELAAISAMSKETYGEITEEKLDEELNNRPGEGNYSTDTVDEGIAVTFLESGRIYLVETNGNVSEYKSKLPEPTPEDSSIASFTMIYGVIEVEFLSGTGYTVTETPNTPILKGGMEGVYWTDSTGVINTANPQSNTVEVKQASQNYNAENWYAYTAQTEANDEKISRWANATTSDGSYYVWIPRYAYRIIYFDTEEHEIQYRAGTLTEQDALANGAIVGYSDARGIVDSEGKKPTKISSNTSISVNKKYFRTHPVFDGKPDEGGWDSKLEGLWVMKYEASKPGATSTSTGSGTIPMSVPNVRSGYYENSVSEMFIYAKNAYNNGETQNTIINSHLMKNSEWGAVAYLTESKYGRNGTEISVYTEGPFPITGKGGQLSSTTGNMYGIYDMSGGRWECVMGFLQDENGNIHTGQTESTNSGFNGFLKDGSEYKDGIEFPTEKKYYQLYINTTNNGYNSDGGMLGDATKETEDWYGDSSTFLTLSSSYCGRGGSYGSNTGAGIFNFGSDHVNSRGFRVTLVIK